MFEETDRLLELLCLKLECFSKLRELGREQISHIEGGRIDELLRVLAVKQRLIQRIQDVETDLGPFGAQDPGSRTWRTSEQREQCARIIEITQVLGREVIEQERKAEEVLSRKRVEAAEHLQGIHVAVEARQAYLRARSPRA